jgi:hypothetical protein
VNAPLGKQPDEVEAMALGGLKCIQKSRISRERPIQNGQIDPSQFLVDDSSRAEIKVTDFRISHLSFGEANLKTTGLEA